MPTAPNPIFDIFISYSRADNTPIDGYAFGWVDLLKQKLEEEDRTHGDGNLAIFMDKTDLQPMDTWPHVLRKRLRQSKILLACISGNFLKSRYCREEWDYYHRVHTLFSDFDGVASVYFVDVLQHVDPTYDTAWRDRIGKTHRVEFMEWFQQGKGAIERGEFQSAIAAMYQQMKGRITDARQRELVPGNLETNNEFFVGREDKLDEVRDFVEAGISGRVTLITGFGGMGKSSLAVEYANRAKGQHRCGVWHLNAENYKDPLALLGDKLFSDPYLAIPDTEANRALRANPAEAGQRVLYVLNEKIQEARQSLNERANVLLVFDNVTESAFLAEGVLKHLPVSEHIHYVATSRLADLNWRKNSSRVELVDLGALEEPAALELLLSRQRELLDFRDGAEREAARDLVTNLLGGYTLAIEQVAVFMAGQTPNSDGPATFAEMNQLLRNEGVLSIDAWMAANRDDNEGLIRHREQSLGVILDKFVLPRLTTTNDDTSKKKAEKQTALAALHYAVCLPATHIPLNWLRQLCQTDTPAGSMSGLLSPWDGGLKLLKDNRLVDEQPARADATQRTVGQMHQVIRDHFRHRFADDLPDREADVLRLLTDRTNQLRQQNTAPTETDLQDLLLVLLAAVQQTTAVIRLFISQVHYLFNESQKRAVSLPTAVNLMQNLMAWFRQQLLQDPTNTDWQRELSVALSKSGDFYLRLGDVEQARTSYAESLQIRRKLVGQDPTNTNWQRNLSVTLGKLGDFYLRLGDVEQARTFYTESGDVLRKLVLQDPTNTDWQRELSVTLSKSGDFYLRLGDVEQARTFYTEDLNISRKLALQDPTNTDWQRELSVTLGKLGDFYLRLGDVEQARTFYTESGDVLRKLVLQDPTNTDWQRELSVTLSKLGDFYRRLGDVEQARTFYTESGDVLRKLALQDPTNTNWQRELSVTLSKLGDLYRQGGEGQLAHDHYIEALEQFGKLVEIDSSNVTWLTDYALAFLRLGDLLGQFVDHKETACTYYEQAAGVLAHLLQKDATNEEWQQYDAHVQARLAQLKK